MGASNPATLSWVLAQEAYGHYYSRDHRRAVEVARQAQGLTKRTPAVGAVLAAALEARAHAAQGEAGETLPGAGPGRGGARDAGATVGDRVGVRLCRVAVPVP